MGQYQYHRTDAPISIIWAMENCIFAQIRPISVFFFFFFFDIEQKTSETTKTKTKHSETTKTKHKKHSKHWFAES